MSNQFSGEFRVSLIVPVRDEAACIAKLIESIAAQTRQPDEIVFVDGGSQDATGELIRETAANHGFDASGLNSTARRIRVIEAGEATPGRGRNIGIAAARNEWIALTDAGIELEPRWLQRLIEAAEQDDRIRVVYGNYEPLVTTFFERCASLAYVAPRREHDGAKLRGPSIASALLHREGWKEVGGFPNLRAAEDLFFIERIKERVLQPCWAPRATARWHLRPTIGATFRKFLLYSKHNVWAGRQWDWHYGLARNYLTALPFIALALAQSAWWLLGLLLVSFARVAKNIWERRDGRDIRQLLNPIQFACTGVILLVIDAASFAGWIQAAIQKEGAARTEDQPVVS